MYVQFLFYFVYPIEQIESFFFLLSVSKSKSFQVVKTNSFAPHGCLGLEIDARNQTLFESKFSHTAQAKTFSTFYISLRNQTSENRQKAQPGDSHQCYKCFYFLTIRQKLTWIDMILLVWSRKRIPPCCLCLSGTSMWHATWAAKASLFRGELGEYF